MYVPLPVTSGISNVVPAGLTPSGLLPKNVEDQSAPAVWKPPPTYALPERSEERPSIVNVTSIVFEGRVVNTVVAPSLPPFTSSL